MIKEKLLPLPAPFDAFWLVKEKMFALSAPFNASCVILSLFPFSWVIKEKLLALSAPYCIGIEFLVIPVQSMD